MSSSSVTSAKDSADDKVNDSADAPVAPDAPKADEANASAASVSINGGENPVPASSAKAPEEEPELKDLETSLLALERLDRASPDLWPDHFPGVSQFVPLSTPQDSPAAALQGGGEVLRGLTQEDFGTLQQLGSLPVSTLLGEVKRLHDVAYELGIEERKEMTRGKYLNIFRRRR